MTIICNNAVALFTILNFQEITQTRAAVSVAGNNHQRSLVRFCEPSRLTEPSNVAVKGAATLATLGAVEVQWKAKGLVVEKSASSSQNSSQPLSHPWTIFLRSC